MLITSIKPLFQHDMYWCPICDKRVTPSIKQHPYCNVTFIWPNKEKKKKNRINLYHALDLREFGAHFVARKTNFHKNTVYKMWTGETNLHPEVVQYLIVKITEHIHKAEALLHRLIKIQKEEQDVNQ